MGVESLWEAAYTNGYGYSLRMSMQLWQQSGAQDLSSHVQVHMQGTWDNNTLNSFYNEVVFNEKLAITKENLHTKYTPFTYNDVALNEKPPIMKENLCIFFFFLL